MGRDASVRREVLTDSVYEAVKAMVMDHVIQPGARVGIDALSRSLGVSPTPVREALARLESDGLVVKRSLSGYRATVLLDRRGVEELFEMRLLLEPRAAALAAEHVGEAELDRIEALVEEMQGLPDKGESYAVYGRFAVLDQRFHDALAVASGRTMLAAAVERLHTHLHLFRLSPVAGGSPATMGEHSRILRAVLRRHPERAAEAMREHLELSLDRHLGRYRNEGA
ncbi:GntR family transcriptional regulator [Streptomyces sp. NBC_00094]|uniref:GntR family transcriptional regulator n=1 Tax=Streptomyces sp. NBC_00094 TaxID=2903620 RepID=UPI00225405B2|nr:GntR family transcriptional regulator [Streptomyces sp. NBC_00094]MCX5395300.1 GntR family transcriptional regulator [Streptomyces sp. NBC_00094]